MSLQSITIILETATLTEIVLETTSNSQVAKLIRINKASERFVSAFKRRAEQLHLQPAPVIQYPLAMGGSFKIEREISWGLLASGIKRSDELQAMIHNCFSPLYEDIFVEVPDGFEAIRTTSDIRFFLKNDNGDAGDGPFWYDKVVHLSARTLSPA